MTIKALYGIDEEEAVEGFTTFLAAMGYPVEEIPAMCSGPSGKNTAQRAVDAWIEFLDYEQDHFQFTTFPWEPPQAGSATSNVVSLTNIEFVSLCAHHWLPIVGKAHIAYIPADRVCGLSKLVRIVDHYSHRPTIQEELCDKIATFVWEQLEPQGVMAVIEAEHMCMSIRGVKRPHHRTVTSSSRGLFDEVAYRAEFMSIIGAGRD